VLNEAADVLFFQDTYSTQLSRKTDVWPRATTIAVDTSQHVLTRSVETKTPGQTFLHRSNPFGGVRRNDKGDRESNLGRPTDQTWLPWFRVWRSWSVRVGTGCSGVCDQISATSTTVMLGKTNNHGSVTANYLL
jgi:hypothetical protein